MKGLEGIALWKEVCHQRWALKVQKPTPDLQSLSLSLPTACGSVCMFVHSMYAIPMEARRGHLIPGTGATNSCESPCGAWELNPGPLEDQ